MKKLNVKILTRFISDKISEEYPTPRHNFTRNFIVFEYRGYNYKIDISKLG